MSIRLQIIAKYVTTNLHKQMWIQRLQIITKCQHENYKSQPFINMKTIMSKCQHEDYIIIIIIIIIITNRYLCYARPSQSKCRSNVENYNLRILQVHSSVKQSFCFPEMQSLHLIIIICLS